MCIDVSYTWAAGSLSLRVSSESQLGPSSMKENKTQKEKIKGIHVQIYKDSFPPYVQNIP
jgi:hypothetical protein